MRLELTEKVVIQVPPGTEQAIVEVATRREISPDDYVRGLVLRELQKVTGFSALARAREMQREGQADRRDQPDHMTMHDNPGGLIAA